MSTKDNAAVGAEQAEASTAKSEATVEPNKVSSTSSKPNISSSDYELIKKHVPAKVLGYKISEDEAAEALASNKGDVKKTISSLREKAFASRFQDIATRLAKGEKIDFAKSEVFKALTNEAVNDALPSLPDARVLEQECMSNMEDGVYTDFINAVFSAPEYIPDGAGKDYILEGCPEVKDKDDALIPTELKDVDLYSKVDTITLPDTIKQAYLTTRPYKYVKFFISGKVDEYIRICTMNLAKALFKVQFSECLNLLKTIKNNIAARPVSTSIDTPTSNHYTTTADGFEDAVAEINTFLDNMQYDDTVFQLDPNTGIQFISTGLDECVAIAKKSTIENVNKHLATFINRDDAQYSLMKRLIKVPARGWNPQTGALEQFDIFGDTPNAILVIRKSGLIRLYNLAISNAAYFPYGLTEVINHFARYTQGCLKWNPCALVNSPAGKGIGSTFYLPVKTTNTVNK